MGKKREWEIVRKEFLDKGLVEELFVSSRGGYSICLCAGWRLMALCMDLNKMREVGEPFWIFISEQDATILIRHSEDGSDQGLFEEAVNRAEYIFTYTRGLLEEAIRIQAETACGEREVLVSKEFLVVLKKNYIEYRRKQVNECGNPPRFSDVRFSDCMIAMILFLPAGGPFWLLGRPLPAILCIINFALFLNTFNTIFFILLGIGYVLVPVLIDIGKLRDRKGLRVVGVAQKESLSYMIGLVNKYQKEIG